MKQLLPGSLFYSTGIILLLGLGCVTQTPVIDQVNSGNKPPVLSNGNPNEAMFNGPISLPIASPSNGKTGIDVLPNNYGSNSPTFDTSEYGGILVKGHGQVTAEPDLAIINAGIQTRSQSVSEANRASTQAMNKVMSTLRQYAVEDKHIQTTLFSISPEYSWNNKLDRQELVGYVVNNNISIKIYDLKQIGPIIDDIARAGGDAVRINGLTFSIDDTQSLSTKAREIAVQDALYKAQQFATLTGVTVGTLIYISEVSENTPQYDLGYMRTSMAESMFENTPVSTGELSVSVNIEATFSISNK